MKKSLFLILMIVTLFMCNKVYAYKEYNIGDEVTYRGEKYYVVENSDTKTNYIVLLKGELLTTEEVNNNRINYVSQDGEYPFVDNDNCNSHSEFACTTNYDNSSLKLIIDGWSFEFQDDLVNVNGYKTRVLNEKDLIEKLGYQKDITPTSIYYIATNETPRWVLINGKFYWTTAVSNLNQLVTSSYLSKVYDNSYIRPVINLNKCVLNDTDKKCIIEKNTDENQKFKNYKIGEEIKYNNELYHVISNSDGQSNYITLLKDNPLTLEEINAYGKDDEGNYFINMFINDQNIGEVEVNGIKYGSISYWSRNNYCTNKTVGNSFPTKYCTTEFDTSDISKILRKWSRNIEDDLIKVDGYKIRLLNSNDLSQNLRYQYYKENIDTNYNWLISANFGYWTMIPYDKSSMFVLRNNSSVKESILNKNLIRPVINLNKCAIESNNSNCNSTISATNCEGVKKITYNKYKIGDIITYKGNKYYVIENSGKSKNYITLLKDESLTLNDLKDNKETVISNIKQSKAKGNVEKLCDSNKNCTNGSVQPDIEKILNNWINYELNENDLIEVNGYKVTKTDDLYMNKIIVPVINVKKDALDNNYEVDSEVIYKNDLYKVIEIGTNYYTLEKKEALNQEQIKIYSSDDLILYSPYYISDTCNSSYNLGGCSSNFNKSDVKKFLDLWSNDFNNDLVSVDGYKTRLLTKYDLIYNLGYDMNKNTTTYVYCKSSETPDWVDNKYLYWSMDIFEDSSFYVNQITSNGCLSKNEVEYDYKYQSSTIRPVINLNKCAIGGCQITEECINEEDIVKEDKKNPDSVIKKDDKPIIIETIVEVAKTLKNIPTLIIVICSILIVSGSTFIVYNYLKSKKERK